MEIFLVGGAVRDFLLAKQQGRIVTVEDQEKYWTTVEKDWVVVGATPEELLQKGFRPVGKSFPVFLHPTTHEEYALARTERKIGKGYTGFECYSQPDVSLQEDLQRRDLTVNAIAMRINPTDFSIEEIIDPYHGQKDLYQGIFRHVSSAFTEDPVRILRIARLASRFADFTIAPATLQLMKEMVRLGEVDALVPERVWQEWYRALCENSPWRFFEMLELSSALATLFPQINPSTFKERLLQAVEKNSSLEVRFAVELSGLQLEEVQAIVDTYRIPHEFRDLALLVTRLHPVYKELSSSFSNIKLLDFFEAADAFRRQQRFAHLLATYSLLDSNAEEKNRLVTVVLGQLNAIDNRVLVAKGLKGEAFAQALRALRLVVIEDTLKHH